MFGAPDRWSCLYQTARCVMLSCLATAGVVLGPSPSIAQMRRCPPPCEPRLKFLDDLFGLTAPSRRDPFEERLETDRHDFTQSTETVGKGVYQLETGYTYFYNDDQEEIEHSHTTPEMMVRLGLSDDIEFRVRWDYVWRFVADESSHLEGAEDLRLAFKLRVTDQDGWIPESALEIGTTAPTGAHTWSTGRMEFGLDYIYGWKICKGWEVYGSTGFATDGFADFGFLPEEPTHDRFSIMHQSLAVGTELNEHMTLFTEYYGIFTSDLAEDYTAHVFNMGLDYYVTKNFVLDLRVGKGLNRDADDLFAGVGGGYRF